MDKMFLYDVKIHYSFGWDKYEVKATCLDNARYTAITKAINEMGRECCECIDCIQVYEHGTDKLYKQYILPLE